jgi:magnesium transporter
MSSAVRPKKPHFSDTADAHCSNDFVSVPLDSTVAEALSILRRAAKRGSILYIYVVDPNEKLKGVIPIRNLLLAEDKDKIEGILSTNVVSLSESTPLREAYKTFSKSKFLSLPVLDHLGRIRGVLHAHELIDQNKKIEELFEERSRGQLFELLGIKAEDQAAKATSLVAGRLPWLGLNLLGGSLSALLIHLLGPKLKNAVQILEFVPVLLVITESLGMQTASMIIANLHRSPSAANSRAFALKECYVAFLVGICSATLLGSGIFLWRGSAVLSATVITSILLASICVSALASAIPYLFRRLKVDPRVAAGPVVLAIADPLTLLLFLLMALWIYGTFA